MKIEGVEPGYTFCPEHEEEFSRRYAAMALRVGKDEVDRLATDMLLEVYDTCDACMKLMDEEITEFDRRTFKNGETTLRQKLCGVHLQEFNRLVDDRIPEKDRWSDQAIQTFEQVKMEFTCFLVDCSLCRKKSAKYFGTTVEQMDADSEAQDEEAMARLKVRADAALKDEN